MFIDDAVDDGQPPAATSCRISHRGTLAAEIRLPHPTAVLRRNALPGVFDTDHNIAASDLGREVQCAAQRHGVERVVDQIGDHYLQIAEISFNRLYYTQIKIHLVATAVYQSQTAVDDIVDVDIGHFPLR